MLVMKEFGICFFVVSFVMSLPTVLTAYVHGLALVLEVNILQVPASVTGNKYVLAIGAVYGNPT